MFDLQSPRLAPLWRRIAITALALGWVLVELSIGAPGWAALFGAASLWCGYQFFVIWNPETLAARAATQNKTREDAT